MRWRVFLFASSLRTLLHIHGSPYTDCSYFFVCRTSTRLAPTKTSLALMVLVFFSPYPQLCLSQGNGQLSHCE
ncbi:hypothetical protein 1013_scaffold3125_00005 [Bacteriophage sp.]|nr:hypothetical protein 1013_scaffold3125_00005 [Bacteriophage sp.]